MGNGLWGSQRKVKLVTAIYAYSPISRKRLYFIYYILLLLFVSRKYGGGKGGRRSCVYSDDRQTDRPTDRPTDRTGGSQNSKN